MSRLSAPGARSQADRVRAAIGAQYLLDREIGRGGVATVYVARDVRHERDVAIKVLDPELASALGPVRFQREIRVAARLQHPHILPVYDSGAGQGVLWFAMPYVDGHTLRQRLKNERRLSVGDAVAILIDLAKALAYAHRRGIVHRDVKPENVLLGEGGVYLMDFGVAKPLDTDRDPQLTSAGLVVGTPTYMAPEQASAEPTDHRADIYSLGIVGYELLAGEPPFVNLPFGELIAAHAIREPEPIEQRRHGVPAGVAAAVARCLRKKPLERWASAAELALALGAIDLRTMGAAGSAGTAVLPTTTAPQHLEHGRAAFVRAAWRDAYLSFAAADTEVELDAEDLERLGEAAWWVADGPTALRAREKAYRRYVQHGDLPRAAWVAMALAEDYFHRQARSVGQGWLRRAERNLEALHEVREHGWLCRLEMQRTLDAEGCSGEALALADRCLEIARRTGDTDLQALALQDRGLILVGLGRVAEGMALIEDAMTAATAGELSPHTTGRTFCNMMGTCHRLGDVGRAAEWHGVGQTWAEAHAESGFRGICRVYRAGILRLRGDLAEAEREARRAAEELKGFMVDVAGEAYYELGEIHLRKGDLRLAETMFTEAHMRGRTPQPGLSLVRLAEGNNDAALEMIERELSSAHLDCLDRTKLLPAIVEINIANGRPDAASEAAGELEAITRTYTSPSLRAAAAVARGMVELALRRPSESLAELQRAQRLWNEIELPYELARTRMLMARAYSLLGAAEAASPEERSAQATLTRIGAVLMG